MPRIELLPWERARALAAPIRFAVFVEEQGVPSEIELDDMDARCVHAVAFEQERAVGTSAAWRCSRPGADAASAAGCSPG